MSHSETSASQPTTHIDERSVCTLRALAMDAIEAANSGHPGLPMGMADAAFVLWMEQLKMDPTAPEWPDRDRFVLSAGHGSMLLYSLLHLTGFDLSLDDLKAFRQWGSRTPGHPEFGHTVGVECTTGPLGQGISMAVGMALGEARLRTEYGQELVDHHTWVLAGDGCLMEGVSNEAASLAGLLKLGRLNVLWDDNHITIDGDTALSFTEDVCARFAALGWDVRRVDGHDRAAVSDATERVPPKKRPGGPRSVVAVFSARNGRLPAARLRALLIRRQRREGDGSSNAIHELPAGSAHRPPAVYRAARHAVVLLARSAMGSSRHAHGLRAAADVRLRLRRFAAGGREGLRDRAHRLEHGSAVPRA